MSKGVWVHIHSLGCPKNDADSAVLARRLEAQGVRVASQPEEASHVLLNTCGFVEEAKSESIAAILDAVQAFPDKPVLAMGCLVQRYRAELAQEIPEVAAWYGLGDTDRVVFDLSRAAEKDFPGAPGSPSQRRKRSFAYVKISDGCDHRCSFCAIPGIKGPYAALPLAAVLEQAEAALETGAREIVLVGQDTAIWRDGDLRLTGLLERLLEYPEILRLRLLYLQPEHVIGELLGYLAERPRVCRYLDIPFQHANRRVLEDMRRRGDGESYLALLERARALMPDVVLRSTFIVGFPGETAEEFEDLLDFVDAAGFHYAGAFAYSPEEGTPAASLPGRLPAEVVRERLGRLSDIILSRAETALAAWIGRSVRVLVESTADPGDPEGARAVGRTEGQAPDIDGLAFLTGPGAAVAGPGDVVRGTVTDLMGLDFLVRVDET